MSAVTPLTNHPLTDHYVAEFNAARDRLPGKDLPWLAAIREQAMAAFTEQGFPSTRREDWKYTDVRAIEKHSFKHPQQACIGLDEDDLGTALLQGMDSHRLVFVNGLFAPQLSKPGKLAEGITLKSLARALEEDAEALEPYLAHYADYTTDGFAALNAALMADGGYIHLGRGAAAEHPIHLIFLATPQGDPTAYNMRNLVVAETGSRAEIIESYLSLGDADYLTNAVTEVDLADNANIQHYKLQQESKQGFHVATLQTRQTRDSHFDSHSISVGAKLARNDINAALDATGAACTLNGLYLANGKQHVDYHTRIAHRYPHTVSHEFYKGVLGGRGRAVFNGQVHVHPDAQKSDAEQANKNLLLSKDAEVDTKPQLEIYANDVKCSHGATVGQLDERMMFYLRSRGIDKETARGMLTYGFAHDIADRLAIEPIRAQVEQLLMTNLPNAEQIQDLA